MMKVSFASAVLCLVTICAEAQLPLRPGIYELEEPGSGRPFTLAIPPDFDSEAASPLILSLHYGGRVTPHFGRGLLELLVEPALRDLGALIVAPDSGAGGWTNAESERDVIELLDYIEASYKVDRRKTLVTGYSMGGAGTWYMAPRHPDRFVAAIPMAGRPEPELDAFDWETPMYVIHSRADELIPLEPAKAAVESLRLKGSDVELAIIDDITHFQMALYRPYLRAAIPWIKRVWGEQ